MPRRPRPRSSILLLLGLGAMGLALATSLGRSRPPVRSLTLTAGDRRTTRALVARVIVDAINARGGDARLLESLRTEEELDRVDGGVVDLALVSEAYAIGARPHLREVAPLYVEALHLLVKEPLADETGRSLGALRGRSVDLGPRGSTSAELAAAVLAFAGVAAGQPDGYVARNLDLGELEARVSRGDAALPDAVLHLATVPSKVAKVLIEGAGYRLVPLPFAEAFRVNALLLDDARRAQGGVEHQHVSEAVIPAFTYGTGPAIPAEPLPTLGARLMLLANDGVAPEAVELVLDTIFGSRVARITYPPLDRGVLALPPLLERHPGTLAYLRSDQPYITQDTVDTASNFLSVMGALAGGGLFLWQWWRQRKVASQDETFGTYQLRIADIERRVAALELAATLELEPLAELQRELLQLKSDALERYAAGDLGSQAALSDLLMPLNAARDHIGDLLLHVRENLEQQAEAEGRSASALWTDAIEKPEEPGEMG